MGVLLGKKIADFQEGNKKIQPAGVDVVPKSIFRIPVEKVDYAIFDGKERGYVVNGKFVPLIDFLEKVEPVEGYWVLAPGIYYIVFPKVKIPPNCIALAYPRSTLNRLGLIKCQTAVFDPGYEGEYTQTWYIPMKLKINVKEPWIQLVFFELKEESKDLYKGYWQNERY